MLRRAACVVITSLLLTATLVALTGSGYHTVSASPNQEHAFFPQMETQTIPSGYFKLTVSPAEVYANVGEQIEIHTTIYSLVDTPIEINSADVLMFDSYGSIIREQAMAKDSYWSANTAYTIVGDEADYQIRFSFSFISFSESGERTKSGNYAEYTADSLPIVVSLDQEPIKIVSVLGPIGPVNPGGAGVRITLKNVSHEPVISLTATLGVSSALGIPFDFSFDEVISSHPLQPGTSTSDTIALIGGGFTSDHTYPLTINATLQSGDSIVYTKLVQIVRPSLIPVWVWAATALGIAALVAALVLIRRHRRAKA